MEGTGEAPGEDPVGGREGGNGQSQGVRPWKRLLWRGSRVPSGSMMDQREEGSSVQRNFLNQM